MDRRVKKNIKALYKKQMQLYLKQFLWAAPVVFFVMTLVFELFVLEDDEAASMLATFGTMAITMTVMQMALGLTVADSQSKNFKYMVMAGVKPFQYLVATLGALSIGTFVTAFLFALVAFIVGQNFLLLLGLFTVGAFTSLFVGITAGLMKKSGWGHMLAMGIGFSIFFAGINDTIDDVLFWFYPRQIDMIIRRHILANPDIMYPRETRIVDVQAGIGVILLNLAIVVLIFLWSNRKNPLERKTVGK
jgi:hypothetical protein